MKKFYSTLFIGAMLAAPVLKAQTTVFSENIGVGAGTTAIGTYTGWQNNGIFTFTGSGDVRNTTASTGYAGASGNGNVFLTSTITRDFQIAGINTSAFTSLQLSFGVHKNTTTGTGADLIVEVSSDGISYTLLTYPALPSGGGTTGWYGRTATGVIPSTGNLRIRFTQTGNVTSYRIDDVILTGTGPALTVSPSSLTFDQIYVSSFSASQTFTLSGSGLTGFPANITITAPSTDFQVSNDNSSWGSSTTIAYTSATISPTLVYVRFSPQSAGAKSGAINITGGGTFVLSPTLNGTGIAPAIDQYRTASSGDWNALTTWERYNGTIWEPLTGLGALTIPNSGDGEIRILNTHTVTVTSSVTTDQTTINNGGQLIVNATQILTIAAGAGTDFLVNGELTINGTVSASSVVDLTIGALGLVNISSTGNLTVNPGGTAALLTVNGSIVSSGTITTGRGNGGTIADVNSGASVILTGSAIWNIAQNGGALLSANSGAIFNIGPDALVEGVGDFILNSGATLGIGSTAGISTSPTVSGNIQNTGGTRTFDVGANYTYNSVANQNMGSGFPNNLTGILTLNNTGADGNNIVTPASAYTIASGGSVVFIDGLLNTTTNALTFAAGSSTSGASNTSYATGTVIKIGATDFTFPVGKSPSGYHPIGISNLSASETFTAEYIRASGAALGAANPPLTHVSNCEYWNLARLGTATANVTLYWTASSGCNASPYVNSLSTLRVAHFNSATWDDQGNTSTSGTVTAGSVTSVTITVFFPIPFTLGSIAENPLPVVFGGIRAYAKNNGIQVDWSVLTEVNVDRYEVERSSDGINFSTKGMVAATNTGSRTNYGWLDITPNAGTNFYRIRNIDKDGKSSYSVIVRVELGKLLTDINIYPNPVSNGYISYQAPEFEKGTYQIRIFNSNGQQVASQQYNHSGGSLSQSLQLPATLKAGVYHLKLQTENKSFSKPFIVQ